MNNYDELDYMHENAKTLSGGNRWAYLAIMITELIVSCAVTVAIEIKNIFTSLFKH